jgi:hypothetical protein
MDVFRGPHWEGSATEDLLDLVEKKWPAAAWLFCPIIFPQENEFLKLFPVYHENLLIVERASVLRC